jgi:hypothetical protein
VDVRCLGARACDKRIHRDEWVMSCNHTTIDLNVTFGGITAHSIAAGVSIARKLLNNSQNSVTVLFPPGVFQIDTDDVPFELSGISPSEGCRLTFRGAGMLDTVLAFDGRFNVIDGRNIYRTTISDVTFARRHLTTTQGVVVLSDEESLELEIFPGFPTPPSLMDRRSWIPPSEGRFFRRYELVGEAERVVTPSVRPPPPSCRLAVGDRPRWPPVANWQVKWLNATLVSGRRWRFTGVRWENEYGTEPRYKAGALVGVKSKHGGQAYFLYGGGDIRFERTRWLGHSRGVLRGGISNVVFDSCRVERPPPVEGMPVCLSTPGGGPQIGHPEDGPIYNVTIRNHSSVGTGDDAVGLFRVQSGSIHGLSAEDSFCRGILLCECAAGPGGVATAGNRLVRAPLFETSVCT